jgi:large repetitive protein
VCTDPSGDTVAAASEAECVTQFVLGVNTVTYTATDAADNVGTCTFDVTVQDLEVPTIDSATCADISATTDPGEAYGSTAFDVPSEYPTLVATDNQVAAEDLVVKSFVERCVAGVASLADCRAIADGFTWDSAALTCTEDATSTEVDPSFCYHSRALQWSASAEQLSTGTDGVCLQLAHSDQEACESDSNLPSPSWEWVEVTALTRFPIGNTELALVVSDGFNVANTVSGADACRLTLTVVDDEAPAISCGSDPTGTTAPGESFGTIGTSTTMRQVLRTRRRRHALTRPAQDISAKRLIAQHRESGTPVVTKSPMITSSVTPGLAARMQPLWCTLPQMVRATRTGAQLLSA